MHYCLPYNGVCVWQKLFNEKKEKTLRYVLSQILHVAPTLEQGWVLAKKHWIMFIDVLGWDRNGGNVSLFALLDLSVAFSKINHAILLDQFRRLG